MSWTIVEMRRELKGFEQELRDEGLRESTIRTYVDRAEIFVLATLADVEASTRPRRLRVVRPPR